MVYYECFRCGYNTKQKTHFINHLNRKNVCKPIDDNVEIETIKKYYGFEIKKNITGLEQVKPVSEQVKPGFNEIIGTENEQVKPAFEQVKPAFEQVKPAFLSKKIKCTFCDKNFTRQYGLTCHLKICKKKKEEETLTIIQNEEMIKMKKEIEELKKCKNGNITNNTNSHNNIVNNNTININNYGDENLKYLSNKDFAKLLDGIYNAVPKLIEKIHFDPNHPENQNIKYTNQRSPYLKVIKDNKWQLVSKKEELLDLIDNKCFMLKEKYYAILEKKKYNITETQRDKIEEFMEKYHEEDKKMTLDLIERTELMLLNNS